MRVLILAAGLGKRMKSKYPKVIHPILGKPMINWVIDTAKNFGETAVVLGHGAEYIKDVIQDDIKTFYQEKQLGTAHAVMCAYDFIDPDDNFLILYGDVPFITIETLKSLEKTHVKGNKDVTILTAILDNPRGYGRILRGEKIRIVEDKDATDEIAKIREINTGIYVFNGRFLIENIKKIKNNNAQKEYYLTDILLFANNIGTVTVEDTFEISGINNRVQLAYVEKEIRKRINEKLMLEGVRIIDPENTYIDVSVKIGKDTVVYPMTFIEGDTTIGEDCVIGPMTRIKDSTIGNNVKIIRSEVEKSVIDNNVSVGPFSRLREGTHLSLNVKIGNFVETKKTFVGNNSKAQHLSYLGDTTIGNNVNIGAGTITCNYDGRKKHPTFIADNAFIGSNSSLVAPVRIGANSIVGAGSVITRDVPDNALALGRARQINKEGWVKHKREDNKNANSEK
ncbi:bifunctional UDP-N-acetylglucosamine diphosphorylase/glucosamine-1-phosphate N-acetyltransferase GlmU [Thermosipho ferrireducens]|uniref:Bifunctional protein GlmU n=1 Tax=Thermosipho ferrireducens TaxID=2571116 RepID=A0ABX7S4F6_9BACT|nr:bifunctional UDP-N-acetylglucosamine diphosphorylase/glucosamine-1-phosphate N-acetyltransferase GlmU [Thermosipho ferrireducens]QTA37324.1 bifunctional UDP-N-acetylglucosamine diphosphorylase/glucosamine-1-phosphate N-acetyltransferase GlmU [Thermosipho ferrireducens]